MYTKRTYTPIQAIDKNLQIAWVFTQKHAKWHAHHSEQERKMPQYATFSESSAWVITVKITTSLSISLYFNRFYITNTRFQHPGRYFWHDILAMVEQLVKLTAWQWDHEGFRQQEIADRSPILRQAISSAKITR